MKKINATSRIYQVALMKGQKFMRYGVPQIIEGQGSVKELPKRIKKDGLSKIFVVAGKTVSTNGMMDSFFSAMKAENVDYVLFDGAAPNPSIDNVEEAYKMYLNEQCQGFVAFGGGSSMDCAKIAAARVANPRYSVEKMGGMLKVRKKIAPFYAVPTTAGTGSETTIVGVVTNTDTHHKYAVTDPKLLPKVAVLDPELTVSLPASITAATGMDALTHAIEAYINKFGSKFAYENARRAVKMIFNNLPEAFENGNNMEARNNMLKASYYAGVAFTRNCVGYVHALGHPLGGMYNIPHGQAMAAILPLVLKHYGEAVYDRLAELGSLVGIKGNSRKAIAIKFISAIENMNRNFGIPDTFDCIKKEDIPKMANFAEMEGNPAYPVPTIWNKTDFQIIYYTLSEKKNK